MLENLSTEQVHVSGYKTSLIKTPTPWIVVLVTRRGGGFQNLQAVGGL